MPQGLSINGNQTQSSRDTFNYPISKNVVKPQHPQQVKNNINKATKPDSSNVIIYQPYNSELVSALTTAFLTVGGILGTCLATCALLKGFRYLQANNDVKHLESAIKKTNSPYNASYILESLKEDNTKFSKSFLGALNDKIEDKIQTKHIKKLLNKAKETAPEKVSEVMNTNNTRSEMSINDFLTQIYSSSTSNLTSTNIIINGEIHIPHDKITWPQELVDAKFNADNKATFKLEGTEFTYDLETKSLELPNNFKLNNDIEIQKGDYLAKCIGAGLSKVALLSDTIRKNPNSTKKTIDNKVTLSNVNKNTHVIICNDEDPNKALLVVSKKKNEAVANRLVPSTDGRKFIKLDDNTLREVRFLNDRYYIVCNKNNEDDINTFLPNSKQS